MPRERKLIALKEAADYLGVHNSTLYRMLRAGEIQAYKIRSEWRFTYDALDAWIEAHQPGTVDSSHNPHKKSSPKNQGGSGKI